MVEIALKQIAITKPIVNAVNEYNPDIDWSNYTISREDNQGFKLPRMERMLQADISILETEPIEVKAIPKKGVKVNDKLVQLYDIINGRHRVARAILEGKTHLTVNVISNGGKKLKTRRRRSKVRSTVRSKSWFW
jgi:hypothetical protein